MSISKSGPRKHHRRILELSVLLSIVAGLTLVFSPSRQREREELAEKQARAQEMMDRATLAGEKFARVAPAAAGVAVSAVSGAGPFELMQKMAPLEIEELNERLADDPDNPDLLRERARLYEYIGDYEAALVDIEKVQRDAIASADLLLQRARLLASLGRYSDALRNNRTAATLEPGERCQTQLAEIYIGLGRYQESLEIYGELEPRDASSLWGQGAAYRGLGDNDRAESYFEQSRILSPSYCRHWKGTVDPGHHEGPHYIPTPFDNL